jgi:Xaa-Pro dipeptidase
MSSLTSETITKRQQKLAAELKAANLEALVLNPGPSLTYMTGLHFHVSERPVVVIFRAEGQPVMVLPELEKAKADHALFEVDAFTYPEDPTLWGKQFEKAAQAAGIRGGSGKLGVEPRYLRMLELNVLQAAASDVDLVDASEVVSKLRMYKDEAERASMQSAVDVAQRALEATLPKIKIGMSEKEVGAELVMQLFANGSDTDLPFMPIIAGGPNNSANPHAFMSERKLQAGDLLVIDWGATRDGYFADLTRTFAVGSISAELQKIHQTVLDANQAAHAATRPGVTCGSVDKAARDVIEKAGYGKYFTHRLGHGLGMDGHEEPYMRGDNTQALEAGMTFTIEPGIYIDGQGGVRIEDDVIVTEDGIHSFSDMMRGLQVVGG